MSNDREHQQRLSLGGQTRKGTASCAKCSEQGLPKCACGPGQGGKSGGSGGSGSGEGGSKETTATSAAVITNIDASANASSAVIGGVAQQQLSDISFNAAILSQLLSHDGLNKLFLIERTELGGIKIECKPDLFKFLSVEQNNELKKFLDQVVKEFNSFKEQNNISNDCCKVVKL